MSRHWRTRRHPLRCADGALVWAMATAAALAGSILVTVALSAWARGSGL